MSELYYPSIPEAIKDFSRGKMMVMVDDEGRENEGDLIIAAQYADAAAINFMCHQGRGLICLSMLGEDFSRLSIPMMVKHNRSSHQTPFGVSFEAARDISTGISAQDRAVSIAAAISDDSGPNDIVMPGHMFPLRAACGGVLVRAGHTEGCTDMARLAGLKSAGVLCEVMNEDGSMARRDALEQFARLHRLKIMRINDLVAWRKKHDPTIFKPLTALPMTASASLPLADWGQFTVHSFPNALGGADHLALVADNTSFDQSCLVRIHSECLTGDVFGSARCDCGLQRSLALQRISEEGGVFIYLRQEGRGIGITHKIKAYALQDAGMDTVQANEHLGFASDERTYEEAAQILRALSVTSVRLLTNNVDKIEALKAVGFSEVERVALQVPATDVSMAYMKTKKNKMGHLLDL